MCHRVNFTSPRLRGEVDARSASGEGRFWMRGANAVRTNKARRLRRNSTRAELRLWNNLRARALAGHKFVRQEPIGPYVVDFVCRERRLIIEVDGGQHSESQGDKRRDRFLRERDYRVLRFWNNDVICNMTGVLEAIAAALDEAMPPHPVSAFSGNRPLPASGER
jgi:very-short-patch-repair endonuclease